MHLIVGLGNPGTEHRRQRHNIGFMALDAIAQHHGFPPFRSKFNGLLTDGTIKGQRFLLLKPQTYMNRSGTSVGAAAKFYKLDPTDVTVIYDEIDLAPGKVKVKTGGGNGGHNGLRSIDPVLGRAYQRVRLGIGHPGHKDRVSGHVLGDFAKSDAEWLEQLLVAIAKNAGLLGAPDGAAGFMNKLALETGKADQQKPAQSKPAPKKKAHPHPAKPTQPTNNHAKPNTDSKTPLEPRTPLGPGTPLGPMAAMLAKLLGKDK